jgi:hypothetical protein
VVTVNVALVAPAATVTLAGTAAPDTLLERETTAPPLGAAPLSVTVPIDVDPPFTVAGLSATEDSATAVAGFTVSKVVSVVPPYEAEMVTGVTTVTELVVTVNVALVAPAATVTLAGTAAPDALLERETTAPPLGAAPLSVTVPVDDDPPFTVAGLSATEDSAAAVAGFTVSEAVFVVPLYEAEMVTGVAAVTALVVTVNVALVAPAATVTLAGTAAPDALLERETTAPPLGAAPLSVTVPVDAAPPLMLVGLSPIE